MALCCATDPWKSLILSNWNSVCIHWAKAPFSYSTLPLETTIGLSADMSHLSGIVQCLSFCDWVISFIMSSRFICFCLKWGYMFTQENLSIERRMNRRQATIWRKQWEGLVEIICRKLWEFQVDYSMNLECKLQEKSR
jgi:hypothetical protein